MPGVATLLALTACADFLALTPGRASPDSCLSDSDCAPNARCTEMQCEPVSCQPGVRQCSGLAIEVCSPEHQWKYLDECTAACSKGYCRTPNSCSSEDLACGIDADDCCRAYALKGGTFAMRYTTTAGTGDSDSVRRRVRGFVLDRFEVSMSRFYKFIAVYETARTPPEGSGAHPAFPASGWDPAWSRNDALLPSSTFALVRVLNTSGQVTEKDQIDHRVPVRGVNWFIAQAFCIWDGGRLPSEAEWAYAALGADESRAYPWSEADDAEEVGHSYALYSDDEERHDAPALVGTHPQGRGRFRHDDLSGNVAEWVLDTYRLRPDGVCEEALSTKTALPEECLQLGGGEDKVVLGGAYSDDREHLLNGQRTPRRGSQTDASLGFRCARNAAR